jgi:2-phospho-L-lactate guanylyltransferase
MGVAQDRRWWVVVPVKRASSAKSRLQAPLSVPHVQLARAVALDTLAAVAGTPGVRWAVVTGDREVAAWSRAHGGLVVVDPGGGLNAAALAGVAAVPLAGAAAVGVAVLLGDVPALRPADLTAALRLCARHPRAAIADHRGDGTVLLAARRGADLAPSFGPGSAARHAADGVLLTPRLPRLRRDVDDAADLAAAVRLGVGPHTLAVLRAAGRS